MVEMAKPRSFSRRSFIAGAAALTAAGALAGCQPSAEDKEPAAPVGGQEEIYSGACRGNCHGGCYLNVHARDGRIVRTTAGDLDEPEYRRICARGATHVGRIYSAKRIQYPMRRIGERGAGEFERISWDEAIDEICAKWKAITDEHGLGAMAVCTGSGNFGVSGTAEMPHWGSITNRFINAIGASFIHMDLDASALPTSHVAPGLSMGTGEPKGYHKAKTFICWGANPAMSQPHNMHFIMEAKEQGTRYIAIDPAFNANVAKADWHLPINATTDGALGLGVINEMLAQGWVDMGIVRDKTNAPFLIKEDGMFLRMSDLGVEPAEGEESPHAVWDNATSSAVPYAEAADPAIEGVAEVDGIKVRTAWENLKEIVAEYTLEKTSEITGLAADDIAELARVYAQDGPVMTYTAYGFDHYLNAHFNHWPVKLVSILSGNCGSASAGQGAPVPSFFGNHAAATATNAAGEPGPGRSASYLFNQIENIIDNGTFGNAPAVLKGVYFAHHGWLSTMSDHGYCERVLSKLDLVIVTDICMTETAKWADILLPAAHWFEVDELCPGVGTAPYLIWSAKAAEPLHESRGDFDILKDIAVGLGAGEFMDVTLDEFAASWLDVEDLKNLGVTLEALKEKGAMRHKAPFEDLVAAKDQAGIVFGTATGRAELYTDVVAKWYDIGQEYHQEKECEPYWEPTAEIGLGGEQRGRFPFHLLTEHMRTRTHSQWWECDYVKEYEAEPVIKISPSDAAEKGIAAGDLVRIFNDRGYVVMKAVVNPGLPKGTIATTHAWDGSQYIEGHPNSLLTKEYCYAVANQAFNDCAVDIEKI